MATVSMFSSPVDDSTTENDSAVVRGSGAVTLAAAGAATMGSCVLTLQVSYDDVEWQDLLDTDGNSVTVADSGRQAMFQIDGGAFRVKPVGATGTTNIPKVFLVGKELLTVQNAA